MSAAGAADAGAGAGAPAPPQKTVPYARRLLLKSLLRAIAIASYTPGAQRVDDAVLGALYASLRVRGGAGCGCDRAAAGAVRHTRSAQPPTRCLCPHRR